SPYTADIYTLSLHDALPICSSKLSETAPTNIPCVKVEILEAGIRLSNCVDIEVDLSLRFIVILCRFCNTFPNRSDRLLAVSPTRSEEHTSELQSRENLVCRL